jgi:hypothetical protein
MNIWYAAIVNVNCIDYVQWLALMLAAFSLRLRYVAFVWLTGTV